MADVPARLSVLTLGVRDLPAVRRFYEALGWPAAPGSDDEFTRFDLGGAILTLYSLEALAEEANLPLEPSGGGFLGFTCAITVESEDLVDAAFEKVSSVGGRILAQPVKRAWGGRSGYFADPEGHAWEVVWLPGARFDGRGALIWPS